MNYMDCTSMLYKYAEETTPPTDYAKGGAALGGLMGVSSSFKKQMGPKKNVAFKSRLGNLGKSIAGGGLKGTAIKATLGATVGAGIGASLNAMQKSTDEIKQASYIDYLYEKVASNLSYEDLKRQIMIDLMDKIRDEDQETFLDDINCSVCGYHGRPDNEGKCPNCGQTLGHYPAESEPQPKEETTDAKRLNKQSVYDLADIAAKSIY